MDKDLDNLPEEDRKRIAFIIDQLQVKDSLRAYNSLVEKCFNDCVNSFWRKDLTKLEDTCVRRCAEKFMRFSMHASMKLEEVKSGAPPTKD